MPVEGAKEVAKVAVEASGSWPSLLNWIGGGLVVVGTSVVGVWSHLTHRVGKAERDARLAAVIKADLDKHVKEEDKKFDRLIANGEALAEKVHAIAEDVAFIKGKMN